MLERANHHQGRFLGVVRLDIGGTTFTLPIQALEFARDDRGADVGGSTRGHRPAGGFFSEKTGELGILVEEGTEAEMNAQIERACADAVTHLSRRVLS